MSHKLTLEQLYEYMSGDLDLLELTEEWLTENVTTPKKVLKLWSEGMAKIEQALDTMEDRLRK